MSANRGGRFLLGAGVIALAVVSATSCGSEHQDHEHQDHEHQDHEHHDLQPRAPSAADVEALLAQLEVYDAERWTGAVASLAALGVAAVPRLVRALEAPHRSVREGAAHALGDMGGDAAGAVSALLRTFREDEDDFVRWKAARALGRIGRAAEPALPWLRRAASSEKETEVVRATAIRAVEQISGGR